MSAAHAIGPGFQPRSRPIWRGVFTPGPTPFQSRSSTSPARRARQATTSWFVEIAREQAGSAVLSSEASNVEILRDAYRRWHETRGGSVEHFMEIVDQNIS